MTTNNKSFLAAFAGSLVVFGSVASLWTPAGAAPEEARPAARRHVFAKRAEAETHRPPNAESRIMLTADQTDGRYSIVDEVFKVGMQSMSHTHTYHSETFLVLKGRMEWTVGGETQTIGPGDLVYIPPDTHHSTKVLGAEDLHAIMIYEPGGYELNLRRRLSMTSQEMKDPKAMRMMMEFADVWPTGGRSPF